MNGAYSILVLVLFLGVLPMIFGQIWKGMLDNTGYIFVYLSGFITIWAIFQLLGVPMVLLYVPLNVQVCIFNVVFILLTLIILYFKREAIKNKFKISKAENKSIVLLFRYFSVYEWIYFAIVIFLIFLLLYYAIFFDVASWRSDDGEYVVISSSAIHNNMFYTTDSVLGNFQKSTTLKYKLCGIYVFYAYVAVISKLGVAIIEHTICSALYLLMSLGAIFVFSCLYFEKNDISSKLVFLIITIILILFGYYSRFSLTMRMLGTIWHGKSILATMITPFLLAIWPFLIEKGMCLKGFCFAVVISLAAISLTLGGIIVLGVIPAIISILLIVRFRRYYSLIYLPFVWAFPILNMLLYISTK